MVNVIDYMPGDTLLHRLNPVIKLGLAAAIIIGIFLSDTYVALLGFLALTLALGAYAGVVDRLLALLKLLIPLALIMLVLQLAFMRDGNVVWSFVTDEGLITGTKALPTPASRCCTFRIVMPSPLPRHCALCQCLARR